MGRESSSEWIWLRKLGPGSLILLRATAPSPQDDLPSWRSLGGRRGELASALCFTEFLLPEAICGNTFLC